MGCQVRRVSLVSLETQEFQDKMDGQVVQDHQVPRETQGSQGVLALLDPQV